MAKIQSKQIAGTSVGGGLNIITEVLTVTNNDNGMETLNNTPTGVLFMLIVNGVVYMPFGNNPPFTLQGNVMTWNTNHSGFDLMTTDSIIAIYSI